MTKGFVKSSGAGLGILLIAISIVAFVSSILMPIFIPLLKDGGTNIMATVQTASVNTTITTFIGLIDYVSLFWYIGIVLSLMLAGVGIIIVVTKKVRG